MRYKEVRSLWSSIEFHLSLLKTLGYLSLSHSVLKDFYIFCSDESLSVQYSKLTKVHTEEVFQSVWKIGTWSDTGSQAPLPPSSVNLLFFLLAARGFLSISSQRLSVLRVGGVPPSCVWFWGSNLCWGGGLHPRRWPWRHAQAMPSPARPIKPRWAPRLRDFAHLVPAPE